MLNAYRLIVLLALMAIGANLFAQNSNEVSLKTGTFTPPENLDEETAWRPANAEIINGYFYRLIQFDHLPSQEIHAILKDRGIQLLDYLPKNTYTASIPAGISLADLGDLSIRSIFSLPAYLKVDPRLTERPLPEYALRGGGLIELQLSLFRSFPLNQVEDLLGREVSAITAIHTPSNLVSVITPIEDIELLSQLPIVQFVEPADPPGEPENYTATSLHRSNTINANYAGSRKYDGTGVNVQLQDDGLIGPHIDYQGRIGEQFSTRGGANNDHGDHIAGTILGGGNLNPRYQGMAPGAQIYVYDYEPFNDSIVAHYQKYGIRITSTSYSNGCNDGYTANSRDHDMETRLYPELIHVFSAGNNGTSNCGYGAGSGWGNVTGGHKVGKNVIAVANVNEFDQLANSSSRGPAADGRIKPDISAKGTGVQSTVPFNNYDGKTGTSMSCPGVSGSLAQLYSAYRQLNGNVNPPSNLMKATILNTADDLGNIGPDFRFGWGRINDLRAAKVLENNWYMFDSIGHGQTNTHNLQVPANVAQVNIMVYYHDYEALAGAQAALVNDLNLTVTDPNTNLHEPWVLDHTPDADSLNKPAVPGRDSLNNMEQVSIMSPTQGTYTISIDGHKVPFAKQEYVIVYEFVMDEITVTYPVGGESMNPNETEILRWDAFGSSGNFTVDVSYDDGANWETLTNFLPGNARSMAWTIPDTISGQTKFRVSRNGTGISSTSERFSILASPLNLRIDTACCVDFVLAWDSVPGAVGYQVYKLGARNMDSVGQTTNTSYPVPGNPNETLWVSVAALGPNGAISKRAIAIPKNPGTFNCFKPVNAVLDKIVSPINSAISSCTDFGQLPLTVWISAGGSQTLQDIPIKFQVDNDPAVVDTFKGSVSPGNPVTYTLVPGVSLNGPGLHVVNVWVDLSSDQARCDDTLSVSLEVLNLDVVSLPYNENFENTPLCDISPNCAETNCQLNNQWFNEINGNTDDIDWRTDNNGTFSGSTGPTADHNPGTVTGRYVYTESSGGCEGVTASMISPCFDLAGTTSPRLRFWYHMNGIEMGSMHLDIYANGTWIQDVWTLNGSQGNLWQEAIINLDAYSGDTINIRFRGITGNGYRSDMALDDITVYDDVAITTIIDMPDTVCVNEPVTISHQTSPGALEFNWNFGSNANPPTANTEGPHSVTFTAVGSQQVQLTSTVSNRTDTDQRTVMVIDKPSAQFAVSDVGLSITTNNTSTSGTSYSWDFGDGSTSSDVNPDHTYSNAGVYTITLIGINQCGSDTTTQVVNVNPIGIENPADKIGFYVSPNPSDGIFSISIERPGANMTMQLFDATGRLVASRSISTGGNAWQGQWDNRQLAAGSYLLQLHSDDGVYQRQVVIQ